METLSKLWFFGVLAKKGKTGHDDKKQRISTRTRKKTSNLPQKNRVKIHRFF